MSYPYSALLPLLQFHCTPAEYQGLIAESNPVIRIVKYHDYADYWKIVPSYTFAECPFCHLRYRAPADTYSLVGWAVLFMLVKALYVHASDFPSDPPCPHFLGIHEFFNLHGIPPTEIDYLSNENGEVPYLTPGFFFDDIESYGVLHALPICRIEGDQFVPRYTLFSLTYFSENPQAVIQRTYDRQREIGKGDPEYRAILLYPPIPGGLGGGTNKTLYDLAAWANKGRLGWLDLATSELPLRIGPGLELPEIYRNIQGSWSTYVWRKGQMRPF